MFMDNLYTSPDLFAALLKRKTFACGTVRNNKIGFPKALSFLKARTAKERGLQMPDRGDVKVRRKHVEGGSMLAIFFQDKKQVLMLSTIHTAKMVTLKLSDERTKWNDAQREKMEKYRSLMKEKQKIAKKLANERTRAEKERLKELKLLKEPAMITEKKPLAIYDYNYDMGGPDHLGQLIDSYDFLRATVKWTKKFTLWMFSCVLVNAFILNRKFGLQRDISHWEFRHRIITHLLAEGDFQGTSTPIQMGDPQVQRFQPGFHYPIHNPTSVGHIRRVAQLNCYACNFSKGELAAADVTQSLTRKKSSFSCADCKVCLCIQPCFEYFHKEVDYKTKCLEYRHINAK